MYHFSKAMIIIVVGLTFPSPIVAQESNWIDVTIDSINMRLPDLPRMNLHWVYGIELKTAENANSFVLSRGVNRDAYSPMDSILSNLGSYDELGLVTLLSVGPRLPRAWSENVPCSRSRVFIREQEVELFCYPLSGDAYSHLRTENNISVVSNRLRFFEHPTSLSCRLLNLSNDPEGIICRLRRRLQNDLAVTVDLYINDQKDGTWPNLDATINEWEPNIRALEKAVTEMISN